MTVRVLISDKMDPKAAAILRERGIDVDEKPGLAPDELKAIIGDYDGLAIRSATKVTKTLLESADRLKVVGRAGIGVDNVDIPAATARGVVVMLLTSQSTSRFEPSCSASGRTRFSIASPW